MDHRRPRPRWLQALRERAKALRKEVLALFLAIRHPRTPWYAKALASLVVVYAVSPLDLIPDAIPVLGYLDDLILVPLGILLARRMIPPDVLTECRRKAAEGLAVSHGWKWAGAAIVVLLWLLVAAWLFWWLLG